MNACLNAASAVLLAAGYCFIRNGKIAQHRLCMVSAFLLSAVFLASYLIYHYHVGHVRFPGQGPLRFLYFTVLISHTAFATLSVPLILRTLYLALRQRFDEHRRIAPYTWPIWMYVSVTGVLVYLLLYKVYPPGV